MALVPETRYAKAAGVHVAYQVIGDAPTKLVFLPEWLSNIEVQWEEPSIARFLARASSFATVILLNRRGTGMSDPVAPGDLPTLEQWMDDVRIVMDAAGVDSAVLWGLAGGGPMAALFAATFPTRTSALILTNTFARLAWAPDHPIGEPAGAAERVAAEVEESWGTGRASLRWVAPSVAGDDRIGSWIGRYERLSASPAAATAILRMVYEIDVRDVLPSIRVPTLVLHRRNVRFAPVDHGRDLARRIPTATYVELPGDDLLYWAGDSDALLDEVEEYLTGERTVPEDERFLTTLLLVDVAASTRHVVSMGDRRWRDALEAQGGVLRQLVRRFSGRVVDTAGDGLLASFDGPARAIRCGAAIVPEMNKLGVEVRVGVHTGEVEPRADGIAGLAVHAVARIATVAAPGEVLVSRTVRDLVAGAGISFTDRGIHRLRGIPDRWQLYAVQRESVA